MRFERAVRRWAIAMAAALSALLLAAGAASAEPAPESQTPDAKSLNARPAAPLEQQIPRGEGGEERFYDAASWRALVRGKTLTYLVGGKVLGREYYEFGSDRVVYVYFDGQCFDGTWSESDGIFCFEYQDRYCFRHLTRNGELIAREMDGDEQIVSEMTDQPLSCRPDFISRADPSGGGRTMVVARARTEAMEDHRAR